MGNESARAERRVPHPSLREAWGTRAWDKLASWPARIDRDARYRFENVANMGRLKGDYWFYRPTREIYGHPADFNVPFESVAFPSRELTNASVERTVGLYGWFFPAHGGAKGTVIHCHGNAGNVSGHFQYVVWMPMRGWNLLCFDYRGFGRSSGRPTRAGTIEDVRAAIDYVKSRDDVDASRLALFGQSLGAAAAIVAASGRSDLKGVALEGAFASYRAEAGFVCRQSIILRGIAELLSRAAVCPGYDPIDHVAGISPTPSFFITGTADRICDPEHTMELYRAAGEPKTLWVIDGGSHTAALTETNGQGARRIDEFLTECVGG